MAIDVTFTSQKHWHSLSFYSYSPEKRSTPLFRNHRLNHTDRNTFTIPSCSQQISCMRWYQAKWPAAWFHALQQPNAAVVSGLPAAFIRVKFYANDTILYTVTFNTLLWYEKNNLIYRIKSVRILYRNNRVTGWLTSVLFYIEWGWC